MDEIKYKPIGIVHSSFKKPIGVPIQSAVSKNTKGTIEIFKEYSKGLEGIERFSYIILLCHLHFCKKYSLKVVPYMDKETRGVFATRAPCRPNSIGISIVHLVKVEKNIIYIEDIDIVDGTPLLDIKPYVPQFDIRKTDRIGWLKENIHKLPKAKDDGRFIK